MLVKKKKKMLKTQNAAIQTALIDLADFSFTCTVIYKLFARDNFVKTSFSFDVIGLADFNLQSLRFGFIHALL